MRELTSRGHDAIVQSVAGVAIGLTDDDYQSARATVVPDATSEFAQPEMIIKVKEPQASELPLLRSGQIFFTYLRPALS